MTSLLSLTKEFDCEDLVKHIIDEYPGIDKRLEELLTHLSSNSIRKQTHVIKVENVHPLIETKAIYKLTDVSCISPRGNFALELHPSCFVLVSKDKSMIPIPFTHIDMIFNLPKASQTSIKSNDRHIVLTLRQPIPNGKQTTQVVIMQPKSSAPICEPSIMKADGVSPSSQLDAILHILSHSHVKIRESDKLTFCSTKSLSFIKCYQKAKDGVLYPLKEGMLYFSPPLFINRNEIASVASNRGGARTFDLQVLKSNGETVEFNMIDVDEQGSIGSYVNVAKFSAKMKNVDVGAKEDLLVEREDKCDDATESEKEDEDSDDDDSFEPDEESTDGSGTSSEDDDDDSGDEEGKPKCIMIDEDEAISGSDNEEPPTKKARTD